MKRQVKVIDIKSLRAARKMYSYIPPGLRFGSCYKWRYSMSVTSFTDKVYFKNVIHFAIYFNNTTKHLCLNKILIQTLRPAWRKRYFRKLSWRSLKLLWRFFPLSLCRTIWKFFRFISSLFVRPTCAP